MDHGYFDRSWSVLTHDPGWWKTMVQLTLIQFIPIFGQIVALGFLFRWARDAAWGVEKALPSSRGDFGAVLKSGTIMFVTLLCWTMAFSVVNALLAAIPVVGVVLDVILSLLFLVVPAFLSVMGLRGVIYDSFEPVLQIGQAWRMVRDEPLGFIRVFGISLLPILLTLPLDLLLFALFAAGFTGVDGGALASSIGSWTQVVPGFVPFLLVLCIFIALLTLFGCMLIEAVFARSVGYWMAPFEPARWGSSHDGVPEGLGPRAQSPASRG